MTFTEFQRAGSCVANQGRERMQRQGRSSQEPIVEPWGRTLSSVPFSCSVVSDSFWPQGLQHARLPRPPPSPAICSKPCPLSQWCHPTISSWFLLLFLPSIFPSIRILSSESTLHIRWPKYWSFRFNISATNEYSGWFPLGSTCLISLLSKGLSRIFSSTTIQKYQFFGTQPSLWSNSYICTWLLEKP